jgi:hypothetical protein
MEEANLTKNGFGAGMAFCSRRVRPQHHSDSRTPLVL